jgi:holo-[acyl-carrier protein] synthase
MGVVNQRGGKPTLALTGGALARLQEITPAGMSPQIDLTLTDEYPMAQAFVIISATPGLSGHLPRAAGEAGRG